MRIAIAACPEVPVPPKDYGGTERRLDVLARRLAARGHDVTLLCGPGSTCQVRRVETSAPMAQAEWEHVDWLRKHRKEWDVLLDATRFHHPSRPAGLPVGSPTVAEMVGDPHKIYPHDDVRNRVYCSPQLAAHFGCPKHPVLHTIVCDDPASVPLGDGAGGHGELYRRCRIGADFPDNRLEASGLVAGDVGIHRLRCSLCRCEPVHQAA